MADRCTIPASDICWPAPDPGSSFVCDPCINWDDPQDLAAFDQAWGLASAFVYGKFARLGHVWPGECFVERVRPCVPRCKCRCPQDCDCGSYNYLDLSEAGFCLPIVEVLGVNIRGGHCCPCNETGVLRPCDGNVRLEYVHSQPRLVRQQVDGCCPMWWPTQDLCRPDGAECTWSIDVRTGCNPPPDVLMATANLAVEIIKECQSTGCTLPAGATRVTTRGVTFERDPEQVGSGFWWSMLTDLLDTHDNGVIECFMAPDWCDSVEWHHVFGPSRFSIVDCEVVPNVECGPVFGVPVVGSAACCGQMECRCGPDALPSAAIAIGQLMNCCDEPDCSCDPAGLPAVARAIGGLPDCCDEPDCSCDPAGLPAVARAVGVFR